MVLETVGLYFGDYSTGYPARYDFLEAFKRLLDAMVSDSQHCGNQQGDCILGMYLGMRLTK